MICDCRDVIKLLLRKKEIKVNDKDDDGNTALTRFIDRLVDPEDNNRSDVFLEVISDLADSGADMNATTTRLTGAFLPTYQQE